jgi:DNA-binding GntR family transcriptional regulator
MTDDSPNTQLILHQTIQESVADYIRARIMAREYRPGERLVQDELAEQLGVSRTPIREALQKLASEGYVVLSPHRGASVADFSLEELEEIYSVRIGLESYAAYLAAQRITEEELGELEAHLRKMDRVNERGDVKQLIRLNRGFHVAIYAAARQPRLYDLIINYLDLAERYRRIFHSLTNRAEHTVDEHQELFDALRCHDAELATRLTREHLEQTASALVAALLKREEQDASASD